MPTEIHPGTLLLNYRVVEKLGEGGMGVVWKAIDTSLDRPVALKLLPDGFGDDPERLARFEREAKTLAALNHPNVVSLFGLHESDGTRFITMECVEGEDLSHRIARGAVPCEEMVPIAIGIAEALSTAHARGIVHRDLKPANVLLDIEGTPRVLDFGLAKTAGPVEAVSGSVNPVASPTITSLGTVAGMLLGTAAYMSPEQARGKPVDRRADIWALGCILFEGLTGAAPFAGETISDTLAGVLKSDPDWDALPASTPPSLRRILQRCLTRNLRDRFQDAGDLRYELRRVLEEPAADAAPPVAPGGKLRLAGVALLVVGMAVGGLLRHLWGESTGAPDSVARTSTVSQLLAPPGTVFAVKAVSLSLSPDGSLLAYAGVDDDGISRLHVHALTDGTDRPLPQTEGATIPFWSPDGRQIGFYVGSTLMRIGLDDAQPRPIAEIEATNFEWNVDGTILASGVGPSLLRVDPDTGDIASLPRFSFRGRDVESHAFLPDGNHFLFQHVDLRAGGEDGIYLGSTDSNEARRLIPIDSNALHSNGHVIYHDGPRIVAQPIDLDRLELTGTPFVIAQPVFQLSYPLHGFFTVARDRPRLVYLAGTSDGLQTELVWFDRQGQIVERTGIRGDLYNPVLSRDARRILVDVSTDETDGDIWMFDLARGSSRQLTDDPADESRPVWSNDEQSVVFYRTPHIYRIGLRGSPEATRIHSSDTVTVSHDLSRDGTLVFSKTTDTGTDLWLLDTGTGTAEPWLTSNASAFDASLSPGEDWIAYNSNETGRPEVYIESFPERSERFQVSRGGGSNPSWRGDGQELYYASANNEIVAVPVDLSADTDPVGEPRVLFRANLRRDLFTPHPDGQRFLVVLRLDPAIDRAVLVDDWDRGPGRPAD